MFLFLVCGIYFVIRLNRVVTDNLYDPKNIKPFDTFCITGTLPASAILIKV